MLTAIIVCANIKKNLIKEVKVTFKELKIGDFFIPSKRSKLDSKFGSILMKKTSNGEMCSMESGASFPVHQYGIITPNDSIIKVVLRKHVLEMHG